MFSSEGCPSKPARENIIRILKQMQVFLPVWAHLTGPSGESCHAIHGSSLMASSSGPPLTSGFQLGFPTSSLETTFKSLALKKGKRPSQAGFLLHFLFIQTTSQRASLEKQGGEQWPIISGPCCSWSISSSCCRMVISFSWLRKVQQTGVVVGCGRVLVKTKIPNLPFA